MIPGSPKRQSFTWHGLCLNNSSNGMPFILQFSWGSPIIDGPYHLLHSYNRHPIARLWWWALGCLSWVPCLRPIHEKFCHHDSNSMGISFCSHPSCGKVMAMKIYTWHDSCAVMSCAKFCSEYDGKKSIVKWAHWSMFYFPHDFASSNLFNVLDNVNDKRLYINFEVLIFMP